MPGEATGSQPPTDLAATWRPATEPPKAVRARTPKIKIDSAGES